MAKRPLLLTFILLAGVLVVLGALLPAYEDLGWWKALIIGVGVATIAGVIVRDRMADTVVIGSTAEGWR